MEDGRAFRPFLSPAVLDIGDGTGKVLVVEISYHPKVSCYPYLLEINKTDHVGVHGRYHPPGHALKDAQQPRELLVHVRRLRYSIDGVRPRPHKVGGIEAIVRLGKGVLCDNVHCQRGIHVSKADHCSGFLSIFQTLRHSLHSTTNHGLQLCHRSLRKERAQWCSTQTMMFVLHSTKHGWRIAKHFGSPFILISLCSSASIEDFVKVRVSNMEFVRANAHDGPCIESDGESQMTQ